MSEIKKDKNTIPDYEFLFQENAEQNSPEKAGGILKMLLKQNAVKIVISSFLFIVKASPTWAIPLVTAEVINIITSPGDDAIRRMFIYSIILLVLLLQNIPTHVLYSRFTDKILRTVSGAQEYSCKEAAASFNYISQGNRIRKNPIEIPA